jgi:multidrug efflux pump subunit AcrA (membrane-fusion protein)
MQRQWWFLIVLIALLLPACAAPDVAQPTPPTPTPLPPAPELERPTFVVEQGSIARAVEVTGRVTPVDLVRLAFAEGGRVAELRVARGDVVQAGDVLAVLSQEAALEAMQQAELAVTSAERDLAAARTQQALAVEQARLRLAATRERQQRLPAGPTEAERARAQDEVVDAERAIETTRRTAAAAKTAAETALAAAVDGVLAAQQAYSDAYWAAEQARGTFNERFTADALAAAERDLRAAERGRASALLALDEAQRAEREQVAAAEAALARARRDRDLLAQPDPTAATSAAEARQAVAEAELAVRAAQQTTFAREQNALDAALLNLEQARRVVAAGRIVAPQDGEIVAVGVRPGDTVEAFAPLIELANPAALELAAELSAEQQRELAEGQPAEVRLLSRPDLPLPAVIRRLPAAGSGVVRTEDRTTRFQITDLRGQALDLGAVARVRIVQEQRDGVLLLPPEAIRAFEGRRFVIVREGERERRVAVRLGVETAERVEILEGLEVGDVVVGQ